MATTKSKGDYSVNKARDELLAKGYLVEKAKSVKYQPEDFFSCWDIIAVNNTHIRFIQVSRKPLYDRGIAYKQKLLDFPLLPNTSKEYWYHTEERFKVKYLGTGQEQDKGTFYETVKKNRVQSYTVNLKPSPEEIDSDGIIEDDPTIPF